MGHTDGEWKWSCDVMSTAIKNSPTETDFMQISIM